MAEKSKSEVRTFWSSLYESAYADLDAGLDSATLLQLLGQTEAMFRYRGHLATTEIPLADLQGKRILEVGCGAGSHSALFAYHGANMTSLDLSYERAYSTQKKFALLGDAAADCTALQGDGESLPFADDTFDIVYSNGVLHHSPDTDAAIAELLRVLKPGGLAIVMLYCKSSINYWVTLWFGYGVLRGGLLRGKDRLGSHTEWAGTKKLVHQNPITRSYTRSAILKMFIKFSDVRVRKSEFAIVHLPKVGRWWQRRLRRLGMMHPGGLLPYGSEWPMSTNFEKWLGRYVGWAWNIVAVKPKN